MNCTLKLLLAILFLILFYFILFDETMNELNLLQQQPSHKYDTSQWWHIY